MHQISHLNNSRNHRLVTQDNLRRCCEQFHAGTILFLVNYTHQPLHRAGENDEPRETTAVRQESRQTRYWDVTISWYKIWDNFHLDVFKPEIFRFFLRPRPDEGQEGEKMLVLLADMGKHMSA